MPTPKHKIKPGIGRRRGGGGWEGKRREAQVHHFACRFSFSSLSLYEAPTLRLLLSSQRVSLPLPLPFSPLHLE